MTTDTPDQVRRLCLDALAARKRADELAVIATGPRATDQQRHEALAAWRHAAGAEKLVREIPIHVIADATDSREVRTGHMLFDELLEIVRRVHAGEGRTAVAMSVGRYPSTVAMALEAWDAGTSRAAKRARKLGVWPTGRAAA